MNPLSMLQVPSFKFSLRPELSDQCLEFNKNSIDVQLKPESFLPCKADDEATGYDVRCADPNGIELKPFRYIKIPLGFRAFSPLGWWLRLVPRSSTLIKRRIHALYGVIDESYENEFYFIGQYIPDCYDITTNMPKMMGFGERIAQLIPVRREHMNCDLISVSEFAALSEERKANRGEGGFGSTGSF